MSELIGNGYEEKWYPIPKHKIKSHISKYVIDDELCPDSKFIIANISYNIQYLRKTLNKLNLSEVLQIQTIKALLL